MICIGGVPGLKRHRGGRPTKKNMTARARDVVLARANMTFVARALFVFTIMHFPGEDCFYYRS